MSKYKEFIEFRQKMNEEILKEAPLEIKRFFNLDTNSYKSGILDEKTKELLGLVASMVLRCDECINYHLIQAKDKGVTREELYEVFSIALIVGGSIVIPHLRNAVAFLDEIEKNK